MTREIAVEERYAHGRIEVWRRNDAEEWFVSVLPDAGQDGYPGHTYARARDLPSNVADDPGALLEWARSRVATP